ncbi:MAG: phosphotransferase family protein [Pyrinomonadaceae bacterium]
MNHRLTQMDTDLTETQPIRQGEEINIARLETFLCRELDQRSTSLTIEQFPAGSSNLTYLVKIGTDQYVLRRPPFGNTVKTAHDMRREFDVLSKLSMVYAPAPKPLLYCNDEKVIGSEFYLMERRHGLIIRGSVAQARASARAVHDLENAQDFRLGVCRSFIRNLADLHALDYKAAGLSDLGKPDGYNRRQVEGWTKRYFAAKTHDHDALEKTIVWLGRSIPPESGAALIHNDYKFDNIMLDPDDLTRITAVLDWEMVTVGDPLMDLGTTLGYWMSRDVGEEMLSMPFNPRVLMENVDRDDLVQMYAEASGRDVSNILFYYVFGTFKIAVIAQQIYARYVKGFTQDLRFAHFDRFVAALGSIAMHSVSRGTI